MRMKFPRLPLMSFTAIAMIVIAAALVTEQNLQQRRADISAARATYLLAIADTKNQLLNSLSKVTGDGTLVQNMNWKLQHSVKGNLEGKLQKGSLDQIAIIGRGCNEIGHAAFNHMAQVPCPFEAPLVGHLDEVFWTMSKGTPMLALAHGLGGLEGTEIIAIGAVQLDEQWLGMHPQLALAIDQLGLQISDNTGLAIAEPSLDLSGATMPTLRSTHYADRFILTATNRNLFLSNIAFWPSLGIALGCLLIAMGRERANRLAAVRGLTDFVNWCCTLTPSSESILAASGRHEKSPLNLAKKLITHALQLKSDAIANQDQKKAVLSDQVTKQEDELQKLRSRLSDLAELDSLALQLQHSTSAFLKQMEQFRGETDDLTAGILTALSDRGQALRMFLDEWQQGINERGARKFIRGLAETQITDDDGVTELDRQLGFLISVCSEIGDVTHHAKQVGQKLITQANLATKLAGLWHGLAMKTHDAEICENLQLPIDEAQTLVRLAPGLKSAKFINPGSDSLPKNLPELPRTVWVSALYHVYLALADLARSAQSGVVSRVRVEPEKSLLVIQVASQNGAEVPKRSDKQAYHLDIARAILSPFQIALTVLPALEGPYPVVLSWSNKAPYRHRGTSTELLTRVEQAPGQTRALPTANS